MPPWTLNVTSSTCGTYLQPIFALIASVNNLSLSLCHQCRSKIDFFHLWVPSENMSCVTGLQMTSSWQHVKTRSLLHAWRNRRRYKRHNSKKRYYQNEVFNRVIPTVWFMTLQALVLPRSCERQRWSDCQMPRPAVVRSYGRVGLGHQHHAVKEVVVGKKNSGGLRNQ